MEAGSAEPDCIIWIHLPTIFSLSVLGGEYNILHRLIVNVSISSQLFVTLSGAIERWKS